MFGAWPVIHVGSLSSPVTTGCRLVVDALLVGRPAATDLGLSDGG